MDNSVFQYVICKKAFEDSVYLAKLHNVCKPEYMESLDAKIWLGKMFEFYSKRGGLPNFTEMDVMCSNENEHKALASVKAKIDELPSSFNYDELISNTETFCRERAVFNVVSDIIRNRANEEEEQISSGDILDMMTKACNIHIIENLGWNYTERIEDFCKELHKVEKTISTGFSWLDKQLGGGWLCSGKCLYMICGQTNIGKSVFLGQFAARAYQQGKNVVLISLEMSEFMYAKRITANLMKLGINELDMHVDEIKGKALQFKNTNNGKLIIKEFPTRSITVGQIGAYLDELKRSGVNPDIIFVDYLNLLLPGKRTANSYEEGKVCAEELRALTYKFGISCVTATQLNRSGFGQDNPSIDKVAESIGTAYTCDAQMSIWQTDDEHEIGTIHMGMQKSRFGKNFGQTLLTADFEHMTINELDENEQSIVEDKPAKIEANEPSIEEALGMF